jgi:hypothetical protein
MKKQEYNKLAKKDQLILYIAKVGTHYDDGDNIYFIIKSEEKLYFRIKTTLDQWIENGLFDGIFRRSSSSFVERGKVIHRNTSEFEISHYVKELAKNLNHVIYWHDFVEKQKQQEKKGQMIRDLFIDGGYHTDFSRDQLSKISPLKMPTLEEYKIEAMKKIFPEFNRKMEIEWSQLKTTMEIM